MAPFKKILVVVLVSAALVIVPIRSQAILPVLIAGWLLEITGGSILLSDLVAGQAGIVAAILWYDCNKFTSINTSVCTNKPQSMPAAQAPKPAITVNLKPDAKRENPNPSKFSDPAPGSGNRDVTPKPVIAAAGKAAPASAAGVPGVPTMSRNIGVLRQGPRDANVGGAGGDDAVNLTMYNQSYSNGLISGIVVVPQRSPAPDKAIPFLAIHTTCAANTNCIAPVLANEQYLQQFNGGKYIVTGCIDNCSGTMRYISVAYLFDYATDVTLSCDSGYSDGGTDGAGKNICSLVDATKVKKPDDTPCEILFDPVSKQMLTDKANPACDGFETTNKVALTSSDGSQSIEVGANAGNGFDVAITKADGSKTAFDTGVYDPGTGGYVIVHTTITPPPKPDSGMGCGGPGQSICSVEFALDAATAAADSKVRTDDNSADNGVKGQINNIDPNKFAWSFIPNIPTAACSNPHLKSPIGNAVVDMDICGWFSKFSFFLNALLAILCLYGCVRQIQSAIRS